MLRSVLEYVKDRNIGIRIMGCSVRRFVIAYSRERVSGSARRHVVRRTKSKAIVCHTV